MNDIILSIVAATLLILLLIAGIIIILFISSRQRMRQKLAFEQESRRVETEISEQMMRQFANELHDNIGQSLTVMRYQVENWKLDSPERRDKYASFEACLNEVDQNLRLLSRTLNNEFVAYNGLLTSIQLEANRIGNLKRFNIRLEEAYVTTALSKDEELMVFRIFQEILQNIMKHAGAENVIIRLKSSAGLFELEVTDDGMGFDYEKVISQGRGSGLFNIRKRADLMKLDCTIQSKPGAGTRYFLKKSPN